MKYILGLRSASLCCHGNAKLLVLSERQVAFGSGHRLSWFSSVSPDRYCSSTLDLFLSLQTAVHYTQYAVHPVSAVHYTQYAVHPVSAVHYTQYAVHPVSAVHYTQYAV